MKALHRIRSRDMPEVLLDANDGFGIIKGEMYGAEIDVLFQDVEHWLRDYASLNRSFLLEINTTYFNTSASKNLTTVIELFNKFQLQGEAGTDWIMRIVYPAHDEDIYANWQDILPDILTFSLTFHAIE
jgi:hypothetical protein